MAEITEAKRRIVERLKRLDSATATELASDLGLTDTAVRQHLDALAAAGLVSSFVGAPAGRGRPPVHWRLAASASDLFPDRHGDLTVDLLDSVRQALGSEAVDAVIATRARRQASAYRRTLDGSADLASKVRHLAALRSDEGYLAEAVADGDGWLLVEHHCPIASAAHACTGLCNAEIDVFRDVLGDAAAVTREQHLVAGDGRCTYRIVAS